MYSRFIFPFLMDLGMRGKPFAEYRKSVLAGVHGEVLEIGAGTGLNFEYYPDTVTRLVTVDPNPGMKRKARRRASKAGLHTEHHQITAETLPFDDAQFDAVISTWTLCSISDPLQALREIHRVLRQDGVFRFVEHGLAPDPKVQTWQRRLNPVQAVIADGCQLHHDFPQLIHQSGFADCRYESFYVPGTPRFAGYFYLGSARKSTV